MARAPAIQEIEEAPEADRLDGFPHPRMTDRVFGHGAAEVSLGDAFRSGRLHHGWLVTGPEGIGKATLSYRFARFLLAKPDERQGAGLDVSPDAAAHRQVRALSHPGLLVIRRAYDQKTKRFPGSITVDEVRKLKSFLARTPDEGMWRCVIVDRADDLNVNAANALLKSLEEPPVRTVFLLISSAPGRLLTTIRSRTRMLDLGPLGSEDLRRAVTQAFTASGEEVSITPPTGADWEKLEPLASGSVRRAISLHAEKGIQLYDRMAGLVAALPRFDWGQVHTLADELSGSASEQKFELFYELLLDHLSRLVRASALSLDVPERALADRLIGPHRLASFAALWERLSADKAETLALNLDRKALILDVFSKLESAATGRF